MPCCCCRFYWWWMIFSRICRPFSSLSYDWRLITIRCNATRLLPTQIASNPTIISSANIGSIRTRTLHQFEDIKEEFISLTSFVFVMYIACWVIRCFFFVPSCKRYEFWWMIVRESHNRTIDVSWVPSKSSFCLRNLMHLSLEKCDVLWLMIDMLWNTLHGGSRIIHGAIRIFLPRFGYSSRFVLVYIPF